jgi:YD repeat-containing protein
MVTSINPENGTVTYAYDQSHHVTSRTDVIGSQTQYTYDSYARLTEVQYFPASDGGSEDTTQRATYDYDGNYPCTLSAGQHLTARIRLTAPASERRYIRRRGDRRLPGFLLLSICIGFLCACSVGRMHTGDSTLERNFARNEAHFDRLIADLNSDTKIGMVDNAELRYDGVSFDATPAGLAELRQGGFSADRWDYYRRQLKNLGLTRAIRGERGDVELPVDEASLSNGSSYKGYWYSTSPPGGHQKTKLDDYRLSKHDLSPSGGYFLYKPIRPNWYLYLFIDGH